MKFLPLLLLLLLPLQALRADRNDDDRRDERPRVILYSGDNYTGVAIELDPREEITELSEVRFSDGRKAHDRISSVRIFGGLRVTLWMDPGFVGPKLELTDSVPLLKRLPLGRAGRADWDNCISSVRVGPGNPRRDPDRRPHRDIGGMIERAFRELLQRDPSREEIRTYRAHIVDDDWDDNRLRDAIRDSREYRTLEVDRIIVRVYREMLGREPDDSDRERARRALLKQRWTEQRLRESIRQSDEYRRRHNQPPPAPRH